MENLVCWNFRLNGFSYNFIYYTTCCLYLHSILLMTVVLEWYLRHQTANIKNLSLFYTLSNIHHVTIAFGRYVEFLCVNPTIMLNWYFLVLITCLVALSHFFFNKVHLMCIFDFALFILWAVPLLKMYKMWFISLPFLIYEAFNIVRNPLFGR